MLIKNILTFFQLGIVYKNENFYSAKMKYLFRKEAVIKQFENDHYFSESDGFEFQKLLKTLFKISCVAPIFCLVKLMHSNRIEARFSASVSNLTRIV